MTSKGFTSTPLSFNRKMVKASASVSKRKNAIHSITEVDVTVPRNMIKNHFRETGEKLSFTGYIVTCLAQVIKQHPQLNAFIKGNRLICLDDVCVSVLIEREFDGEVVPEPVGINGAQEKTYRQISDELRDAGNNAGNKLGSLSKLTWIRFIPGFLLKTFVRIADRNLKMAKKYGKVAVTAVGMYSKEPVWFIPHGTATVLVTAGSIINRVVEFEGKPVSREHLCLTVSFDHNIVDGAPAARFMNQFVETLKSGKLIRV
jgi:pyruvate/2-oxoglutarate dehydrogenase complex dihydrolipoamide acyltransferase (E2) component